MSGSTITKKPLGDNKLVVDPGSSLDNSNAGEMLEIIYSALSDGVKYLILDMANLEHLSSAGVGTILGTLDEFREADGDIILCNVPENILHILQVLDLTGFLTIKTDFMEATEFSR